MAAYGDEATWQDRFEWIDYLEYSLMRLPLADIVFLLTMPAQRRTDLLEQRERGALDAHEGNGSYLDRVEQCFHALMAQESTIWRHIPAAVDGAVQTPAGIHERVWQALTVHPRWQRFVRA